eukprot:TRINITY_DN2560_c1_g1_i1.p1 TRINITY_DN2560_c1_g1~~TRINITY_DN2560_c1_g1_i1.p1  ORF type:complete len:281 (+),score=42.60 TRINITY_DN2560_c1_g1_i1:78-845(+)
MSLENLPSEVIFLIISFLDFKQFSTFSSINKQFYSIYKKNFIWKNFLLKEYSFIEQFLNFNEVEEHYFKLFRNFYTSKIGKKNNPLIISPTTTDGGEYSDDYGIDNLVKPQTAYEAYCSKQKNKNVHIQFQTLGYFILTGFTIISPRSWFTAPVNSGLIFLFNRDANIEITKELDGLTFDGHQTKIDEFQEKYHHEITVLPFFNIARKTYQYFLEKPLIARNLTLTLLDSSGDKSNIDIQTFLIEGYQLHLTYPY